MIDPATALAFSVFENPRVFALLLGSGVSRASQIPTGWEIILDLAERLGRLEGAGEQKDWAAWYRGRFGIEPNYSALLDSLSNSPAERRSILHKYIEPNSDDVEEGRKVPNRAHQAISKLVSDGFVRVVITTNFDRLLEQALRDEGVEPTIIRSDDDIAGAVPLIHSQCYLIKVHGDYLDARIRNTAEELESYSNALNLLLDRILEEHGLITCGWSADWDYALRAALTRTPNRRYPFYWAAIAAPSQSAGELIIHRNGVRIAIDNAESFFENLQAKVEAQAAMTLSNPKSCALVVATAKKYLSKPEFRIRLHDLMMSEASDLKNLLSADNLSPRGQWSQEEFRRRVACIEVSSERLMRLCSEVSRWGDKTDLRLCLDVLRSFDRLRMLDGLVVYARILNYPAVLLLYAVGIGLLRAGRLKSLFEWFSASIDEENMGGTVPAVQKLFLWNWSGDENKLWNNIEGLENRKTALSDHLFDVMKSNILHLALSEVEFEALFERFEFLGSLASATFEYSEDDLKREQERDTGRGYASIPVGRIGWRVQSWRSLQKETAVRPLRSELLAAGFCHSSEKHLDLTILSIERMIGNYWWRN